MPSISRMSRSPPPVPPAEGEDFLRIAAEAEAGDELWVDIWVRMIGVEAALLGAQ